MDQKYKRKYLLEYSWRDKEWEDRGCLTPWIRSLCVNVENSEFLNKNGSEQPEVGEREEEFQFKKRLEDAETPLYSNCANYTKVAAIMGLYHIKVKSGI